MSEFARVPLKFESMFKAADQFVSEYFSKRTEDPEHGQIVIWNERYILIRAASFSVSLYQILFDILKDHLAEKSESTIRNLLFKIGHSIGKSDAKFFSDKNNIKDPHAKFSAGPIHFAFTGWASVSILPESNPVSSDAFYLIYDHPFSFESDSWLRSGLEVDFPVCFLNAGYSSGWCEHSFGIPLIAAEILCQSKGDETCRFIMSQPSRIRYFINKYRSDHPQEKFQIKTVFIPGELDFIPPHHDLKQELRQRFAIFDRSPDTVLIIDDNHIRYANALAEEMTGLSRENLEKSTLMDISSEIQGNNMKSRDLWAINKKQVSVSGNSIFNWRFKSAEEKFIDTEVSVSCLDSSFPRYILFCRNTSHRKLSLDELIQSHRLRSIGSLATGVAHDFNNILAGILSFTALLKIKLPPSDRNQKYLKGIEEAVQTAESLTRRLLSFSRSGKPLKRFFDLNICLQNSIEMLRRTIPRKYKVVLDSTSGPMTINGDPNQIEQVVLNLCLESVQAMPDGGDIHIILREVGPGSITDIPEPLIPTLPMVLVEVRDNRGFMDALQDEADMFGSGNEASQLPIIEAIVRDHGGFQQVIRNAKTGCSIRLFFPLQATFPENEIDKNLFPHKGRETIAILESDPQISRFFTELLSPLGYVIIPFDSPETAIAKCKALSNRIDVIVLNCKSDIEQCLDIRQSISDQHPAIKTIIVDSSGLSVEMRSNLLNRGISGFIEKPFRPEEICTLLRNVLSTSESECRPMSKNPSAKA